MADCPNVEMRELLPERASGALSAADLARVDTHLASCALCSGELALIQSARAALRRAPHIDVARIAASVQAQTAAPARPVLVAGGPARRVMPSRWIGWKTAAAVAIAAAGGGTMLFTHRVEAPTVAPPSVTAAAPAGAAVAEPALNVAGGLTELSETDLRTLLDDLGELGIDAPAFEEPGALIPELAVQEDLQS